MIKSPVNLSELPSIKVKYKVALDLSENVCEQLFGWISICFYSV